MRIILIISLIFCTILFSCKKYLEIPAPENEVITKTVFTNDESALSAVSGLYSQMLSANNSFANGGMSLYAGLSADDIINTSVSTEVDQFASNSLLSTNSIVDNLWQRAYKHIYHCNAVLEGLGLSTNLNTKLKEQLTGEVKLIRAFCYFYLLQLYGDVPLVLTTSFENNMTLARTSKEIIIEKVIADLEESKGLLSINYPSAGRVRPNMIVASALLARVYLFKKEWLKAAQSASEVISNSQYTLPSDLNTVFTSNSTEAIWQLLPVLSSFNTSEGFAFIPSSSTARPAYILRPELLNEFNTADKRKLYWTKTVTISGQSYTYPFKYKVRSGSTKTEYNMVLRLAEMYLIRAEARVNLDQINEGRSDLNIIHQRAGLVPITSTIKSELMTAIMQERQLEFFAEWGIRWFDLKRWETSTSTLSSIKPDWQLSDILYPVPLSQLIRNSALVQNDGY